MSLRLHLLFAICLVQSAFAVTPEDFRLRSDTHRPINPALDLSTTTVTFATDQIPQLKVTALTASLAGKVNNTGNETIAGVKTFSSAPIVPAAAFPESAIASLVPDLAGKVNNTGNESINGVKTFVLAPIVPSAAFPESATLNLTSDLAAKALDSAVVHNTGNEAVGGVKTFSSAPIVPSAAFPESATANLVSDLAAKALDSAVLHNTGNETVAGIKTFSSAPVVPSAAFPESATLNLTSDLALKAADSAVVHNTGNESINGVKSFLTDVSVGGNLTDSGNLRVLGTTTASSTGTGSIAINSLATPGSPTVGHTGVAGGSTWSYSIVAKLADGTGTPGGPAGSTITGNATLDTNNYNNLTWSPVSGAVSYDVYRTVAAFSPSTTGKIANVTSAAYNDQGAAGDGNAVPSSNSTGNLQWVADNTSDLGGGLGGRPRDVNVARNVNVVGSITLGGALAVGGGQTIGGTLGVTGNATFSAGARLGTDNLLVNGIKLNPTYVSIRSSGDGVHFAACDGVTDDSVAVAALTASLANTGATIYVPSDARVLLGGAAPVVLQGVGLQGSGIRDIGAAGGGGGAYGTKGSSFLIKGASSPFKVGSNWKIDGLTFFYPEQVEGTPIAKPPMIVVNGAAQAIAWSFTNNHVVNAYDLFDFSTCVTGGFRISGNLIYAIRRVLTLYSMPVESFITDNHFTYFAYQDVVLAPAGGRQLRNYTNQNGEVLRIIGNGTPSVVSSTSIDGLQMTANYVLGYNTGIHVAGGHLNLFEANDVSFDGVPHPLLVDGGGNTTAVNIIGGTWVCYRVDDLTIDNTAVTVSGAAPGCQIRIARTAISFINGNFVSFANSGTGDLNISDLPGVTIGRTSGGVGPYSAVIMNSPNAILDVTNSIFVASNPPTSPGPAITITSAESAVLRGNQFFGFNGNVSNAAASFISAIGNVSQSTGGGSAIIGSQAAVVVDEANVWDTGGDAWIAYTPTITAAAGSPIATATGYYRKMRKTVFVRININLTNNNGASGTLYASLPFIAVSTGNQNLSGIENAVTGFLTQSWIPASDTRVHIQKYDGTYLGVSGYAYTQSGSYETP